MREKATRARWRDLGLDDVAAAVMRELPPGAWCVVGEVAHDAGHVRGAVYGASPAELYRALERASETLPVWLRVEGYVADPG